MAGQAGNGTVATARPDDTGQPKIPAKAHDHRSGTAARPDAQAGHGPGSNSDRDSGSKKPGEIDKSALAISAPRRVRDKEHLRYVASRVVPLCATNHRALHTVGDEKKWRQERGIDPIAQAERLWRERRGDDGHPFSMARSLISPTPG